MRFTSRCIVVLFMVSPLLAAAQEINGGAESGPINVRLVGNGKSARVLFDGKLFADYLNDGHAKPIIYPVVGPHGVPMTRDWPMKEGTPNEAVDHPHQKSLWYTHGSVNGVDFWAEGAAKGKIVATSPLSLEAAGAGKTGSATIKAKHKWTDSGGKILLTDEQVISFHLLADDERAIDYQVTLIASESEVVLGDTKEGSMGIRTHPALQLKGKGAAGKCANSEGVEGLAIWGKRAKWVDYWAEIDGNTVGVAIFDHPSNPRHPTHWHARDYGLIAANPFGIHDFEKKGKGAGNMTIAAGEKVTFKYRFLFHKGDAKDGKVADKYAAWSK